MVYIVQYETDNIFVNKYFLKYNNSVMKRIIFDVILFISVFVFPWWISVLLLFIGIFAFNNFYEFIIANVIIYSLYSIPGNRLISSSIFFSGTIIILYIIIQSIRNNIILYKK